MNIKKMVFCGLSGAAIALAAQSAGAVATLGFSTDGGTTYTYCADGAACDANAVAGVVTFVGAVGVFAVNVTTGLGQGANPTFLIDLNSVDTTTTGGGTLDIVFSDNGFTQTGFVSGSWGGTLSGSGSVAAEAFYSLTNSLFAMDNSLGTAGPFTGGAFAANLAGATIASGPYSLTQRLTLIANGALSYSGDFELQVPEPGTLALFGLGLIGIGVAKRRRQ